MAHRFKDEWILRGIAGLPGASADKIARWREERRPSIAEELIKDRSAALDEIGQALKTAHGFRWLGAESPAADKLATSLVPEKICQRHSLAPLRLDGDNLEVAMACPLDIDALADVQTVSGRTPVPYYCLPGQVEAMIKEYYRPDVVVDDLIAKLDEKSKVEIIEGGKDDEEDDSSDATDTSMRTPVVRLVNAILSRAIRMKASDIHVEHEERSSHVRLRIDGLLRNVMTLPSHIAAGPVVSRIKIMAEMDIADHRRPQDGRAKIRVDGADFGLRVSVLPMNFGEKVVMRILDPRAAAVPFEKLGFRPAVSERMKAACGMSQGIVLVTGPTGAGKTTTLYAVLSLLKSPDSNLVTIEDPIEYRLEGINQVQVREKQGLTFAAVLRSVLRQDPDVIMLGEIRDQETAVTAFQAALTGHLVLTTLHTNDTIAAITRLSDMGVERFKVASGMLAITAQRLVRRLCPACRKPVEDAALDPRLRAALAAEGLEPRAWAPGGCPKCEHSGFKGRMLIVEFLEVAKDLRERVVAGETEAELRRFAQNAGLLHSLRTDALGRVQEGDTTLEEILPHVALAGAPAAESASAAAAPPAAPSAAAPPAAAAPSPAGAAPRILLCDDDKAIRVIVRKAFEAEGWSVVEASDGEEALEKIAGAEPDVLVLDLDMPKLDGLGVIRGLRQGLGMIDLPIVILTASSDDASQEQALTLGADDFVTKPFKPGIVAARVRALLRRRAGATGR